MKKILFAAVVLVAITTGCKKKFEYECSVFNPYQEEWGPYWSVGKKTSQEIQTYQNSQRRCETQFNETKCWVTSCRVKY